MKKNISDEYFTINGALIQAWASHKRFVKKDAVTIHTPEADSKQTKTGER